MLRTTVLLGALLVPAICFGGTLTATTPTDADGGIFLNLTPAAHQLWATPGLTVTVDAAPGSYIGFESSEVSQTLRETLAAIGAGTSISRNPTSNTAIDLVGNDARLTHQFVSGGMSFLPTHSLLPLS
jgi:hypothetical protein